MGYLLSCLDAVIIHGSSKSCAAAQNLQGLAINTRMQIEPITTTAIATTQSVQNNRVETVRRQYVDNGGRVEVRETYFYYMIYDSKAKIQEPAANQIDLRV
jgi:hypothetical protein